MRTILIDSPTFQLAACLHSSRSGFHLAFESCASGPKGAEPERRFGVTLAKAELLHLRWLIDDVLHASGEQDLERPLQDRLRTLQPGYGPHVDIAFLFHLATARRRRLGALEAMADGRAALTSDDLHGLASLLDASLGRLQVPDTPLSECTARALAAALAELVRRSPCFPFDAEPLIGPLDRLRTEECGERSDGHHLSPDDAPLHSS